MPASTRLALVWCFPPPYADAAGISPVEASSGTAPRHPASGNLAVTRGQDAIKDYRRVTYSSWLLLAAGDVAHHLGVAVEAHEIVLVRDGEPAECQAGGLQEDKHLKMLMQCAWSAGPP